MLSRLRRVFGSNSDHSARVAKNIYERQPILPPAYDMAEFNGLLQRIEAGERISSQELLPFVGCPLKAHRQEVNSRLAEAYYSTGNIEKAKIFIQRSWLLSDFSESVLPIFLKIHESAKDSAAIREAYKRAGLRRIEDNLSPAIYYFGLSQYADSHLHCIDKFEYDFDILDAINRESQRYIPQLHQVKSTAASTGKIRIGYLLRGASDVNSILVKIVLTLIKFHDYSKFDVTVFCPETQSKIISSEQGALVVSEIQNLGAKVSMASDYTDPDIKEVLLETAKQVRLAGIDLLVSSAALSDYSHYFLTCLNLAKASVGLVQGPPQQFAPPNLDWCISWSQHPLIDTPVDCSLVRFSREDPTVGIEKIYNREELGLPQDTCILVSSGRAAKFQSSEHWNVITEVLRKYPDVCYVVIGTLAEHVQCYKETVCETVKSRIKFLGWRADVLSILPCADIIVDTFPSGGGQSLAEAMHYGLPLVAHRNDYFARFDQNNWSPVEDFVGDLETVVARGQFDEFKNVLSKLIEDADYRKEIGRQCQDLVKASASEAAVKAVVSECEDIFLKVLSAKQAN